MQNFRHLITDRAIEQSDLAIGINLFKQGRLQQAEVLFLRVFSQNDRHRDACLALAMTYYAMAKQENFSKYTQITLLYAEKAFHLDPNDKDTLKFLKHCHEKFNNDKEIIVFTPPPPVHVELKKSLDALYANEQADNKETKRENTIPLKDYLNEGNHSRNRMFYLAKHSRVFVPRNLLRNETPQNADQQHNRNNKQQIKSQEKQYLQRKHNHNQSRR